MKKKTIEHAASVVKEMVAERENDCIKEYEIPTLINTQTGNVVGFAVVLTLSSKYQYSSSVIYKWKERLNADYYVIRVDRNRLRIVFKVYYEEDNVQ